MRGGKRGDGTVRACNGENRGAHFSKSVQKQNRARNLVLSTIAVLLVLSGIAVAAFPYVQAWLTDRDMAKTLEAFEQDAEELRNDSGRFADFLEAVDAYNLDLDRTGQVGLRDAWSYLEPSFDLSTWGLPDGVYGRLTIPAASIDMPIHLGATEQNLLLGAAHLTQTSLPVRPVDGVSTNTVLAGHRGYRANTYFNNIVNLVPGDEVLVENPWGVLKYQVSSTAVISPSDIDAVKIQQGRNLLTLVTCHPLYHNYQRYVVYCELVDADDLME